MVEKEVIIMRIKEILSDSFSVLSENKVLLWFAGLFSVGIMASDASFQLQSTQHIGIILCSLFFIILTCIYFLGGAIFYLNKNIKVKGSAEIMDIIHGGNKYFGKLIKSLFFIIGLMIALSFGIFIITALLSVLNPFSQMIGSVLGVIAMCGMGLCFSLVPYSIIMDQQSTRNAFKSSFRLVKQNFGLMVITFIIMISAKYALDFLLDGLLNKINSVFSIETYGMYMKLALYVPIDSFMTLFGTIVFMQFYTEASKKSRQYIAEA